MSRKYILLIILVFGGLIYFGLRNPYYYDRQFHYLTKTDGPSIQTVLTVPRIYIDDEEFNFEPPLTLRARIPEDSSTEIKTLKKINDVTFGAKLTYHYSLTNVSPPGDNPEWSKRMMLEIMFYKQDSLERWSWFSGSSHIIDDLKGTDEPKMNSFTWEDYKTKKEYGIQYDFTVK